MTPPEKIDLILKEGRTPQIHEVVNCSKYPYVCSRAEIVYTPYGAVHNVKGLLSDGSSGPKIGIKCLGILIDLANDICPPAFFAHDKLFKVPYVTKLGIGRKRVGFFNSNKIYGWILKKNGHPKAGRIRKAMLNCFGWGVWRNYRKLEREGKLDIAGWIVPHPQCWEFPSTRTRDARWIGNVKGGFGL